MAVENGDARVTLATLDAQVKAIDRDYQDLRRAVIALDTKLDAGLQSVSTKFETAFGTLAAKFDARTTTQWPAIFGGLGVVTTVLIAVGTALYMPIQRDTSRLDMTVSAILDRGVYQRQYDADSIRTADAIKQLRADYNGNIQQQRYNADHKIMADEIELLRLRSYEQHGRIQRNLIGIENLNGRLDAISKRLAEFIRDMGKH